MTSRCFRGDFSPACQGCVTVVRYHGKSGKGLDMCSLCWHGSATRMDGVYLVPHPTRVPVPNSWLSSTECFVIPPPKTSFSLLYLKMHFFHPTREFKK